MAFRIPFVQTVDRLINQLQQNIKQSVEPLFQTPNSSFVGSLTGFGTVISKKVGWEQGVQGVSVTLSLPDLTGTSTATTMMMTGLPNNLWPLSQQSCLCRIEDNGTVALGVAQIDTNGNIEFFVGAAEAAFTASGTKGLKSCCITYVRGV